MVAMAEPVAMLAQRVTEESAARAAPCFPQAETAEMAATRARQAPAEWVERPVGQGLSLARMVSMARP
jgi:hypothetical protein